MSSASPDAQQSPAPWEPSAFEAFYRAQATAVYRYVYFRVGLDAAVTVEVVGEIFLALWGQPRPGDGEEIPVLYGIARRKLADYFRSRERQREIRFSELERREREWLAGVLSDQEPDTNPPGPLSADARRLIGEVLSALEAPAQELLVGKYMRGESIRSLAQKTGKSEAAVTSALARARQAFRAAFEARMIHGI